VQRPAPSSNPSISPTPTGGDAESVTVDTLLRGRIRLHQPTDGFRSSLDPVLLAGYLQPPFARVLDIGCGTGALSFLVLAADGNARGVAVEIQPRLAALAERGRLDNDLGARLEVIAGDIRLVARQLPPASFDLVVTNPPFRQPSRGRSSPNQERAVANHEVSLTLKEWLDCTFQLLRPGGRLGVIYPAERLAQLLAEMHRRDLQPVRLRAVHPHAHRPATRVLVEAHRGSNRPLVVEPPMVVHSETNTFTAEVRRLMGED
jgi:tRNA1Val (adenine37-N6)-methyltransferase